LPRLSRRYPLPPGGLAWHSQALDQWQTSQVFARSQAERRGFGLFLVCGSRCRVSHAASAAEKVSERRLRMQQIIAPLGFSQSPVNCVNKNNIVTSAGYEDVALSAHALAFRARGEILRKSTGSAVVYTV
jgi:predicted DNA-binding transcriptional regulator AlpA